MDPTTRSLPAEEPPFFVFLGSGASQFAGYRTFVTFPELIFDPVLHQQQGLPPLNDNALGLLDEVRTALANAQQPTTADNILRKLDGYRHLWNTVRQDPVLSSRIIRDESHWGTIARFSQLTEEAMTTITITTVRHYAQNLIRAASQTNPAHYEMLRRLFALYSALAGWNEKRMMHLPVFTTNYDMLLEDLFREFAGKGGKKITLVNGFSGSTTEGTAWDDSLYSPRESSNPALHLFRLHGCVCWFYHGLGDEKVYFHRRDALQRPESYLCAIFAGRDFFRGLTPYSTGFKSFHKALFNSKVGVFVGFSFRDDEIDHMLLAANLQRQSPLKLLIFDPVLSRTDVLANLAESSKRTQFPVLLPKLRDITVIPSRFGEANFDDLLLSTLEQTMRT
jgi:hypothetical protein